MTKAEQFNYEYPFLAKAHSTVQPQGATASTSEKLSIRVTDIGEYIRFHSCDRRFKLRFNGEELAKQHPLYYISRQTLLDPVLQLAARNRENEWESSLQQRRLIDLTRYDLKPSEQKGTLWQDFTWELQALAPGENAYGREIRLKANLGNFHITGQIDFAVLLWNQGVPKLRLVECKASRKDQTYQRVQVALYRLLVNQLLTETPVLVGSKQLKPEDIECVVVRIDEHTSAIQDVLAQPPLDLQIEEADLVRLTAPFGALGRIVETNLPEIPFQLDSKCNDCVFSVHCLSESARERRLELLGLDPSVIRILQAARINNIDELASMDLEGPQAKAIRHAPGFSENLDSLKARAKTRRRKLLRGENSDAYEVEALDASGNGQLPQHEFTGQRLIRIYLTVEYDYVENRLVALIAHVTKSEGDLQTGFTRTASGWQLDPIVKERVITEASTSDLPLQGKDVIWLKKTAWTGDYTQDTQAERELIEGFLNELTHTIAEVANTAQAPLHFYVWSRQELTRLIEGCTRASSQLLAHLQELLGCRESLEQLIYSSLQDEVVSRYTLAWSGQDLSVASSLRWFGQRYHWCRLVNGVQVKLDHEFRQDIFDFKRSLTIDSSGAWSSNSSLKHEFEIRLRHYKSLSAPYWRAYWETLPNPRDPNLDQGIAQAIRRYQIAQERGYLQEFLRARTHFLRWIDERVRFKNPDIAKPALDLSALQNFSLGVNTVAKAAIDFLRLDHHIKLTNWIAEHLVPPVYRLPLGKMIPISNLRDIGSKQLAATIDLCSYSLEYEAFKANCTIQAGDFLRLSPCSDDPRKGQTIGQLLRGGSTCRVQQIDLDRRQIILSLISARASGYLLSSHPNPAFARATLDESPSEFIAGKVEKRLTDNARSHVYQWLDPTDPHVPPQLLLSPEKLTKCRKFVESLTIPNERRPSQAYKPTPDQQDAAVEGLQSRIQLIQGPPGTGKTETTAIAIFLRILARWESGDIVLIAAPTHTAVDTLLLRLEKRLSILQQHAASLGLPIPPITLIRVDASDPHKFLGTCIQNYESTKATGLNQLRSNSVLVVGGTTNGLLKTYQRLHIPASKLILDEASMMVFPHFLALATLIGENGEILLAGDHRQLAPIVAHDWEQEDRPPVLLYQPFVSAYQAALSLKQRLRSDAQICYSPLSFTFRLPPIIRELIARLYQLDGINLSCNTPQVLQPYVENAATPWARLCSVNGLYLLLHNERESRNNNTLEVSVIERILSRSEQLAPASIAIVTPHRAQRTLLKTRLDSYYGPGKPIEVIDTVERLQGGECPTIIVSATASDPTAIVKNVEFILDLNRSNVAFSRAQNRLIVVCSRTLLEYIPAGIEDYQDTMLWKSLMSLCTERIAAENVDGYPVDILVPSSQVIKTSAQEDTTYES